MLAATRVYTDVFIRRGLLFLAVYLLSIFFLAGGIGLLFAGGYLWLSARLGNPAALLITACALLLLGLIFILVWLVAGRPVPTGKSCGDLPVEEIKALESDVDRLVQDLDRLVRKSAPAFTLGAFVLGLAIGVSPKLRRGIVRWLR